MLQEAERLLYSSARVLKHDGLATLIGKSAAYLGHRARAWMQRSQQRRAVRDVLFINGCALGHPNRYRVAHQVEQLRFNGFACDEVWYELLKPEDVQYYHAYIFFRCPHTPVIAEFIAAARRLNKRVFFDIDDLVIDRKYVESIQYLQTIPTEERELYLDGVRRMQQTLRLCNAAITTTNRLALELKAYVPEVFINPNVASEELVKISLRAAAGQERKDRAAVVLGYFSGSITHNADLEMITPVLRQILREHSQARLLLGGLLTVPGEFAEFGERVRIAPFRPWQQLPELIASVDINLVPLEPSIFNEAKSENKWVEAALVKVPTVASDLGPFAEVIKHHQTGFLCSTPQQWHSQLAELIKHEALRKDVAAAAQREALANYTTVQTGHKLARYLRSQLAPAVAFVLPNVNVSGGVNVVLKHAQLLRAAGRDVTIISEGREATKEVALGGEPLTAITACTTAVEAYFDLAVATLWSTCSWVAKYPLAKERAYLVQSFETDFCDYGHPFRFKANSSYSAFPAFRFLTISKWCQHWLQERFGQTARYAPNGLDLNRFTYRARDFSGRLRVLIEGDSQNYFKNIDEAFEITDQLDPGKYEVWYLSSQGRPKAGRRCDRFLHKVPYDAVAEIYQSCHILLKTSFLDSFSYPPLEMMATGGLVIARPSEGNLEFLKDHENCLLYQPGSSADALSCFEELSRNAALREKLIKNGLQTAQGRSWERIAEQIRALYS